MSQIDFRPGQGRVTQQVYGQHEDPLAGVTDGLLGGIQQLISPITGMVLGDNSADP